MWIYNIYIYIYGCQENYNYEEEDLPISKRNMLSRMHSGQTRLTINQLSKNYIFCYMCRHIDGKQYLKQDEMDEMENQLGPTKPKMSV